MSNIATELSGVLDSGETVSSPQDIKVYFYADGENWFEFSRRYTSDGWTQSEIDAAMASLNEFSKFSNLSFSITTNVSEATFRLGTRDLSSASLAGYFYTPDSGSASGIGAFDKGIDSWTRGGLEQGSFVYQLFLHEFGHGLGLLHPHDGNNSSSFPGVPRNQFRTYGDHDLNQSIYTVMSYNDGYLADSANPTRAPGSSRDYSFGVSATPMAIDIAILQDKYGANSNYENGNTVYTVPSSNVAGTGYRAIWDTGGNDTIIGATGVANIIDLRPATLQVEAGGGGWVSLANGIYGGFTIAAGVVIENATGSTSGDQLTGNRADNTLTGNAGNDFLADTLGNDSLLGGDGNDALLNGSGTNTLEGGSGTDLLLGGAQHDTLRGGAGDDIIRGDHLGAISGGSDELDGGTGDDFLMGLQGADTFVFRPNEGNDTISTFEVSTNNPVSLLPLTPTGADFVSGYDVIKLLGFTAAVQADPMNFVRVENGSSVFEAENTKITFFGITELSADDFIFG